MQEEKLNTFDEIFEAFCLWRDKGGMEVQCKPKDDFYVTTKVWVNIFNNGTLSITPDTHQHRLKPESYVSVPVELLKNIVYYERSISFEDDIKALADIIKGY